MSQKLLIVEDNQLVRQLYVSALKPLGADLEHAGSAEEAMDCIKTSKPDLIIMDILLPGMSGLDVTRRLKSDEETRRIPIIAVTTMATAGDAERIQEAGADAYLAKPVNVDQFVKIVRRFLNGGS